MGPAGEPDATLVRFLLGDLGEAERASVEERLFTDAGLRDAVEMATDDLIDAYLADALSAADRERFETHFLASERHWRRLRFVRALAAAADEASARPTPTVRRAYPLWPLAAGIAFLVAGAAGIALFRGEDRTQRVAAPPSPARPDVGVATPPAPPQGDVRTIRLEPAGHDTAVVAVPPAARVVRLELPLKPTAPTYEAVIRTGAGHEVWRAEELAVSNGVLALVVPADVLKEEDYVLDVAGELLRGGKRPRFQRRLRVVR